MVPPIQMEGTVGGMRDIESLMYVVFHVHSNTQGVPTNFSKAAFFFLDFLRQLRANVLHAFPVFFFFFSTLIAF
jgi:hypothetical protein